MFPLHLNDYLLITLALWLAILTIVLVNTVIHYRKLMKGANKLRIDQLLEKIVEEQKIIIKRISELSTGLIEQQKESKSHFQKHSLIRFNPFEDSGGDQSFTVTFLDGQNNGVVLSSLHSRQGTRIYAKGVIDAKPSSHQFSKEEKEAVEKAAHRVSGSVSGKLKN